MNPYDHKKIEKKWQKEWEKKKIFQAKDFSKDAKDYLLVEFPFPSGEGLHTGHIRSYTAMDVVARKHRMEGHNVLYPIGWDAFGLPTENFAIKTGQHPKIVTKKNTDNFRRQLKSGGYSFDWSREVNTSDPQYYQWTQWIFLQMYKKGLAYKKKMFINWCPKDKIGLANEEVIDGKCERCGTVVEKREKEQWMLAITKYADRLDKDLDTVDYQERIKIQQRNWIGRSEGAEFEFKLKNSPEKIKVFTTRADTLLGVTYVVVAPEHELVKKLKSHIKNWDEVQKYITVAQKKAETERTAENKVKTGVKLEGIKVVNPASGEEVSVWIADYVLAHYGTGAVMAVPAHDERDNIFAKKYNLPIKEVIVPNIIDKRNPPISGKKIVERKNIHAIVLDPKTGKYLGLKWNKFNWVTFPMGGVEEGEDVVTAAKREIKEETGFVNVKLIKVLEGQVRAEYFAAHKDQNRVSYTTALLFELIDHEQVEISEEEKNNHEIIWLDKSKLNYENMTHAEVGNWLDKMQSAQAAYTGEGILINSEEFSGESSEEARKKIAQKFGKIVTTYKLRDWVFSRQRYWGEPIPMVYCEHCAKEKGNGWVPVPEKDLPVKLPEVENYLPTDTGESPLAAISKWVNTKCPVCKSPAKRETDTMPNWAGSSWYYLRYADPKNKKVFADHKKVNYWTPIDWYNGGMEHTTLHVLYSRFWHKFLFDLDLVPTSEPYKKRTSHGLILAEGGEKMSKSKGNVVNPDTIIEQFGADTLRLYEMFMGPFDQAVSWSTDGIVGPRRFLEKVWRTAQYQFSGSISQGDGPRASAKASKLLARAEGKLDTERNAALETLVHKTIKKVSDDIESMSFNTAVSTLMILVNEMEKQEKIPKDYFEIFLKLLSPFAPHITEELWQAFGHKTSIHLEKWPHFDPAKLIERELTLAIQINGKVRGEVRVSVEADESEVQKKALTLPEIKKWVDGKTIKKVILVKGRLLNIIVME